MGTYKDAEGDRRIGERRQLKRTHLFGNDFNEHLNGIIHEWLFSLTILAIVLVPLFFLLDYFTMPKELLPRLGIYRLISTIILVCQFFIVRNTKPSWVSYLHGHLVTLNVGGMIALMTVDLGGFNSSYYAGLNLVIVGVNLLLPWNAFHSALNCLVILAMYIGFNVIAGLDFNYQSLYNNLFFIFATGLISISINYVKHRLVKQEFFLLTELRKARDALWSEMELAKRIQTALLPKKLKLSGYEMAAIMSPAKEVGGDYFDVIETKGNEKWVTIGDVSGHGVDAGLIMMMAQTSIQSMVNNGSKHSPSEVLNRVNAVLRENISRLGSDHYMTMMALLFNGPKITVAGKHQDIIVYRAEYNRIEIIPIHGTWLAISDNINDFLMDMDLELKENDVVVLFSDGLSEAENEKGEMFGQERIERLLNEHADLPVENILHKMMNEVEVFQKDQLDDMTLLVIKRNSAVQ